ncbi:MAG: hypothetical protein ACKO21_03545 [Nodosilinea sp.]
MKTLIITVGTRQVGWKCKDGVVRSLLQDLYDWGMQQLQVRTVP